MRADREGETHGNIKPVQDAEFGLPSDSYEDKDKIVEGEDTTVPRTHESTLQKEVERADPHPIEGVWAEPKNLYIILRYKAIPFLRKILTYGTSYDIHACVELSHCRRARG